MYNFDKKCLKKVGLFVGGVLFGSAGFKLLGSSDAKRVYAEVVAAGMRAKDSIMDTAECVQTSVEDIVASAKFINETRDLLDDEMLFEDFDELDPNLEEEPEL